jgi:hypothetical protein
MLMQLGRTVGIWCKSGLYVAGTGADGGGMVKKLSICCWNWCGRRGYGEKVVYMMMRLVRTVGI